MSEKQIVICIGTDRAKNVRARLSLLEVETDGRVSFEQYVSVGIAPGDDLTIVRKNIEDVLINHNSHLPRAPWPKIPDSEWDELVQFVAIFQKPSVVETYKARIKAQQNALLPKIIVPAK